MPLLTSPTPYPELNGVLTALVEGVQGILGDKLIGAYLQGSFAVGDFDEHSDCDFIMVIRAPLTPADVDDLQTFHAALFDSGPEWAKHLEGSYFPLDVLRSHDTAALLWYLDNGHNHMVESTHCNMLLVRWVVRERGVVLQGPPPMTLLDPIPTEALRAEIYHTMQHWGSYVLDHPAEYANRFYQGYLVLNFCRMLHNLVTGIPNSKRAGAEWAKGVLDAEWHNLIDRAWDGRPNPAVSVRTPADAVDYAATLRLVRLLMDRAMQHLQG